MPKHHFFTSFFSTVLLYLSVGTVLMYTFEHDVSSEVPSEEKVITFALSEYEPEPIKEEPVEKELVVEKPVIEEPVPKKQILEELVPEPVLVKNIPQAIVKKNIKKQMIKKKRIKKKPVEEKVLKRKVSTKKTSSKRTAEKKKASSEKKKAFENTIRERINKNKTYPRMAQKIGKQGSVEVRFTILASGRVANIRVTGPKIFHKSAKNAVKKSFPISTKNVPVSFPMTVNLPLHYRIR